MAMPSFDLELALEYYYTKHELTTDDIMAMFKCSRSRATKLKLRVREKMAEEKVNPLIFDFHNVQTEYAYYVWGIDVGNLEKKFAGLMRFRKKQAG